MTKRRRRTPSRRTRQTKRETNWLLIGGIIIGALVLIGLLALALQEPDVVALADFCEANPENCLSQGDENAPVTLVEVSDYGCSHCRDFNLETADSIEQLYVDSGQVHWIVLPFSLGIQTTPAAESAYCAAEQDSFFEYHKQMFEIQSLPAALTPAGYMESAGRAELELDQFFACLENDGYGDLVQENLQAARNAGVSSTPTFFINGVKITGNNPNGIINEIEAQLSS